MSARPRHGNSFISRRHSAWHTAPQSPPSRGGAISALHCFASVEPSASLTTPSRVKQPEDNRQKPHKCRKQPGEKWEEPPRIEARVLEFAVEESTCSQKQGTQTADAVIDPRLPLMEFCGTASFAVQTFLCSHRSTRKRHRVGNYRGCTAHRLLRSIPLTPSHREQIALTHPGLRHRDGAPVTTQAINGGSSLPR